ncbi:MAG: hypothetical protein AAGK78_15645, partial [Planctomycetota bacterium]
MLLGILIGVPLGLIAGAAGLFVYLKTSTNSFLAKAGRQAEIDKRAALKEAKNAAREIELEAKQAALKLREEA